jgi:hypothetical protein
MLTAEDRLALFDLYSQYNRTIDSGDVEGWLGTWADDGIFDHPARPYRGRDELKEFVHMRSEALPTHVIADQRHWNAQIDFSADGSTGAVGNCLLLVAGHERDSGRRIVAALGRYNDVMVRTSAGWRFAKRALALE